MLSLGTAVAGNTAVNRRLILSAWTLLIVAATFWVYWPTLHFGFVVFDDGLWVGDNSWTQQGLSAGGFAAAFTSSVGGHWAPLTWLSHQAAFEMFGGYAGGHHLVNLVLHVLAALLLLAALVRLTGAPAKSGLVAALFALHPTHVESVAWVTERKDVLSGVFFALSLLAYAAYARRRSGLRFAAVALAMSLGLLCKAMLVTTPLVLLALDFWPLGRVRDGLGATTRSWGRVLAEKAPLLVLSGLSAAATVMTAQELIPAWTVDWGWRLRNAAVSLVEYLEASFWPHDLAVFYPLEPVSWGRALVASVLLLVITAGVLRVRDRRPYLCVGWFWFLVMLAPVSGLIPAGASARADRYLYLPSIGLYLAVVWAAVDGVERARRALRLAAAVVAAVLLVALGWMARIQAETWRDSETLFLHAAAVTEGNWLAHHNLAQGYAAAGRREMALAHFDQALVISSYPAIEGARALRTFGRPLEALARLERALAANPMDTQARLLRAMTLNDVGRTTEAIAELSRLVELAPDLAAAHHGLGSLLAGRGELEQAIRHYREAVASDARLAPQLLPLLADLEKRNANPKPPE
jgi:protein O-mannosyl-transferase